MNARTIYQLARDTGLHYRTLHKRAHEALSRRDAGVSLVQGRGPTREAFAITDEAAARLCAGLGGTKACAWCGAVARAGHCDEDGDPICARCADRPGPSRVGA